MQIPNDNPPNLQKLTAEDLIFRALESEKAIAEGKVLSLEELEEEMQGW